MHRLGRLAAARGLASPRAGYDCRRGSAICAASRCFSRAAAIYSSTADIAVAAILATATTTHTAANTAADATTATATTTTDTATNAATRTAHAALAIGASVLERRGRHLLRAPRQLHVYPMAGSLPALLWLMCAAAALTTATHPSSKAASFAAAAGPTSLTANARAPTLPADAAAARAAASRGRTAIKRVQHEWHPHQDYRVPRPVLPARRQLRVGALLDGAGIAIGADPAARRGRLRPALRGIRLFERRHSCHAVWL